MNPRKSRILIIENNESELFGYKMYLKHLSEKLHPCFGNSPAIQRLLKYARVGASKDTIILIQGETGSGKGVLANWIHQQGSRKDKAFVQLNCSELKGDLLRSELFGHAKGAFTSAFKDREGLIEAANGGTLFLDDINDLDLEVQAQLLTAIEERTYRKVGENKIRTSNFRLICASNKDLFEATRTGRFRSDLYYRICVFPIAMPPLRQRPEDMKELAEFFLLRFGYTHLPLSEQIITLLKSYDWPGNIRELRNMIERALLLAQDRSLGAEHFPGIEKAAYSDTTTSGEEYRLKEVERNHVRKVLDLCKGNKPEAAKLLGISLSSLYRRLPEYSHQRRH